MRATGSGYENGRSEVNAKGKTSQGGTYQYRREVGHNTGGSAGQAEGGGGVVLEKRSKVYTG